MTRHPSRSCASLDEIIELNTAKNLVRKLQSDLNYCLENSGYRVAEQLSLELGKALADLCAIQQRRIERQSEFDLQESARQVTEMFAAV